MLVRLGAHLNKEMRIPLMLLSHGKGGARKRRLISSISIMLMITLYFSSLAIAGAKVEICHNPPGNPGLWHTITVPDNAVSAHLAHGDHEGPCDSGCTDPAECDDGNMCTTDDCGYGECVHAAVDCNDDNPITFDYCDPYQGCEYIPHCPEYATWDPEAGVCVDCPDPFRRYATEILSLIVMATEEMKPCTPYCAWYTVIGQSNPEETASDVIFGTGTGCSGTWSLFAHDLPWVPQVYEEGYALAPGGYQWGYWFEVGDGAPEISVHDYSELAACQEWVKDKFEEITGTPCEER